MPTIRKVAILGAGTMGSRIAAHITNAGLNVLLVDLKSAGEDPDAISKRGLDNALNAKPAAFFSPSNAALLETGNFEDHLGRLNECQWILEAITEDLEAKRHLWSKVVPHAAPNAILSTNTSGIPLAQITRDLPPSVKSRFLGTHFFNPPRYLHLLELIPATETDPVVTAFMTGFAARTLGKGVVRCKDTPNFIANRVGSFYSAAIQRAMVEGNYSIEEVDALTGPLIGVPKSASFRLMDVIGLDVWAAVLKNVYDATEDSWRDWFRPEPYTETMIANGWLGDKTRQGFYRKDGTGAIQVLDWKTLEYGVPRAISFDSVEAAKKISDLPQRLRYLVHAGDRAGEFLSKVFQSIFKYAAEVAPHIADSVDDIDRAMRWGFGHRLGPFELAEALGSPITPKHVTGTSYRNEEVVELSRMPRVHGNADASLRDLGAGVLCLEFHSKMNAIGEGTLDMMEEGLARLDGPFAAMIVANQGENFSVGANLAVLLTAAQNGDFTFIEQFIRRFQELLLRMKYAPKPVVCAPFARALGGGAEVVLQCHRVQAFAELNIGLVEMAVGLVPAGGGTKEMAMRSANPAKGFELILSGKVSGSAVAARELGFLQPDDRITMNPDFVIGDARDRALELTADFLQGQAESAVLVSGEAGYQRLVEIATRKKDAAELTPHDLVIAEKLAYVLSGGRVSPNSTVAEQRLLELELEVFLQLCGMSESQQRMGYMLKNGKPLRN